MCSFARRMAFQAFRYLHASPVTQNRCVWQGFTPGQPQRGMNDVSPFKRRTNAAIKRAAFNASLMSIISFGECM